jgi:hypothetical protein
MKKTKTTKVKVRKPDLSYTTDKVAYMESTDKGFKKYEKQLTIRGFTDSETWGLDTAIASFVLPRLVRFKTLNTGFPYGFTEKTWDKALDDMIYAMNYCANEWSIKAEKKVNRNRVQKGCELFGKHFRHLWW